MSLNPAHWTFKSLTTSAETDEQQRSNSKSSRVTHPDAPLGPSPVRQGLDHFLSRDTSWRSLFQPTLQIIYRYPLTHLWMVRSRAVSLSQQKQRALTTTVVSPHTLCDSSTNPNRSNRNNEQRQHRGHHTDASVYWRTFRELQWSAYREGNKA